MHRSCCRLCVARIMPQGYSALDPIPIDVPSIYTLPKASVAAPAITEPIAVHLWLYQNWRTCKQKDVNARQSE